MTTIPLQTNPKITDQAVLQNALEFAYGNARMENKYVTRQMIEAAVADALVTVKTLPTVQELGK